MTLTKEDFFTVHKGFSGKLTCLISANIVVYTLKAFLKLNNVIITLCGQDYSVDGDTVTRL